MRLIIMRHGESTNNLVMMVTNTNDEKLYDSLREQEPSVSQLGIDASFNMGKKLSEMKIDLDAIYCSGHKRALVTTKHFIEGYGKNV